MLVIRDSVRLTVSILVLTILGGLRERRGLVLLVTGAQLFLFQSISAHAAITGSPTFPDAALVTHLK